MEVIVSKSHDEWLKSREGGIGSSEVGVILGLSQYETPYQLWLRKTGQVQKVEEENFLMKAGHYLEDAVSRFYADETGTEIIKSSAKEFVVVDKDNPFMRVSPDRYGWPRGVKHSPSNRTIIECKTTQKPVSYDDIPKTWFVQLVYQLHVCKLSQGALAWLISGREFGYRDFAYDAEFAGWIAEEVTRFWVDCIVGGHEPALVNVQDVLIKFPKSVVGKTVEASDEIYDRWLELKEANAEIKRLQAVKEQAEDAIKMAMGDAEILRMPGGDKTLITWKSGKKGRETFDKDSFKKDHPELVSQYFKEGNPARMFLCKD